MTYDFDPNPEVNHDNFGKHSITLKQAEVVYQNHHTIRDLEDDDRDSFLEKRLYALGKLKRHGIIRINYCYRNGAVRIISAYHANKADRDRYRLEFDVNPEKL